jgi:predicted metal-binding membrane protein
VEGTALPRGAGPLGAGRLRIFAALLPLAAGAWVLTGVRMGGMDGGPGTYHGTLAFFVSTWVVMMAAMMFPSVYPVVAVYHRLHDSRRERGRSAPSGAKACFALGYLATWTATGLIAYAVLRLAGGASIDALAWDRAGRYVAAGVLLAAAAYELTPLKHACLSRCRGPLSFFMEHWRDGRGGALRMGAVHGAWCVGCCWALMAALFALGAMSILWMGLVAAMIALEKLLPWRRLAVGSVIAVLVVLGVAVAFAPQRVPGLVVPHHSEGHSKMTMQEPSH